MPRYIVDCSWRVCGTYYVEAESEDEARDKVFAAPRLPDYSEYADGSFEVDGVEEELPREPLSPPFLDLNAGA